VGIQLKMQINGRESVCVLGFHLLTRTYLPWKP